MLQKLVLRSSLLALALTALFAAPAVAAPVVSGEFPLKTEIDTNNKITAGPDGNAWVTLNGPAEDVARITPAGEVKEFDLAVAGASGITTGPDGNLWVTRPGGVTRFSAADPSGSKKPFEIPAIEGNSPIVTGPDGRLWVATKDKLLAISLAAPTEPQAFTLAGLTPNDIDAAGSLIVVADANAANKRVFAVTTAGAPAGERKMIDSPQGVAGGPNGQWAYTQPVAEPKEIGLLSPTAAPIIVPIPGRDAFGITLGSDGAYWSPDLNSNGLARVTTTGQLSGITGFAKESFPRQVAAGPNNTLWVTLAAPANPKVGLVTGLEPPVASPPPPPPPPKTVPQTKLKGGPKGVLRTAKKFKPVQFGFNSPNTATSFECRMLKLAKKAGKKATASKAKAKVPKFKGCASPKGYKLRPGRYSFEVRAVNDGLVDPTPAKRGFRVVAVKVTASPQR